MTRAAFRVLLVTLTSLPIACRESKPPPLQTVPGSAPSAVEEEPSTPVTPEERKRAIERIDRAIAAHGGPVRLQKLRCFIQYLKGPAVNYPNTDQELHLQFPDRVRLSVTHPTEDGLKTTILAVNGNDAWLHFNGQTTEMPPAAIRDTLAEVELRQIWTLLPLRGDDFVVRPVDGEPIDGKATNGVRVELKQNPAVNLYFDAESHLLVCSSGRFGEAGVTFDRRVVFSEHKSFDGLILPTRIVDWRDGRRFLNCSIDYKFVDQLDAKDLARP